MDFVSGIGNWIRDRIVPQEPPREKMITSEPAKEQMIMSEPAQNQAANDSPPSNIAQKSIFDHLASFWQNFLGFSSNNSSQITTSNPLISSNNPLNNTSPLITTSNPLNNTSPLISDNAANLSLGGGNAYVSPYGGGFVGGHPLGLVGGDGLGLSGRYKIASTSGIATDESYANPLGLNRKSTPQVLTSAPLTQSTPSTGTAHTNQYVGRGMRRGSNAQLG